MTEPSRPSRPRKIGSRSCDACKIRKVKCTEHPPCQRCQSVGIECTFLKAQSARGPRTLRAKTLQQIREAQQRGQTVFETADDVGGGGGGGGGGSGVRDYESSLASSGSEPVREAQGDPRHYAESQHRPPISVQSLVLRLCIYRLRLFPVWPILAVEEVIAALQRDSHDVETFALAVAVGAATMAQLKLDRFRDTGVNDDCTAATLEAECQHIRTRLDSGTANLNRLRTSFFLHIYHENQKPGGTRSVLYLREAITLAQIIGLHRASSYQMLDADEDRLRRRILWLLFVTERGVAALHKLPVVLGPADKLPALDGSGSEDEAHILPAFKKLVHLFCIFDQARAFEILQDAADHGMDANQEMLTALQQRLQAAPLEMEKGSTDIQKADLCVTRQWMQILIWRATWRAALTNWRCNMHSPSALMAGPVHIAQEFLDYISQLPNAALEAHGPAIEFKVYEIASAVADSFAGHLAMAGSMPSTSIRPSDILLKLQRILATSRGGNSDLLGLLATRIAQMEPPSYLMAGFSMEPSQGQVVEESTSEHDQAWVMNTTSSELDLQHRSQDRPYSRNSSSSSPWLSLVAAAELEQQSIVHGTARNAASWYAQPLGLLGQLYTIDTSSSATAEGTLLAGDSLADILAGQQWLLGLNSPRPG